MNCDDQLTMRRRWQDRAGLDARVAGISPPERFPPGGSVVRGMKGKRMVRYGKVRSALLQSCPSKGSDS
jgi:hypothetical protein